MLLFLAEADTALVVALPLLAAGNYDVGFILDFSCYYNAEAFYFSGFSLDLAAFVAVFPIVLRCYFVYYDYLASLVFSG